MSFFSRASRVYDSVASALVAGITGGFVYATLMQNPVLSPEEPYRMAKVTFNQVLNVTMAGFTTSVMLDAFFRDVDRPALRRCRWIAVPTLFWFAWGASDCSILVERKRLKNKDESIHVTEDTLLPLYWSAFRKDGSWVTIQRAKVIMPYRGDWNFHDSETPSE